MAERIRAIVQRHRDEAELARLFHKAGLRFQNVDACLAACKVAWADAILREIDALANAERDDG